MKILVIGGMHGNEPLGLEVVKSLEASPIKNVDTVLANELAIAANVRYVEQDLNRSFPGDTKSDAYERRRAAELIDLARQYDIVLDFHNTNCADNDCSFVGQTAKRALYLASSQLGLKRVVVADYDCINKYAPNCISIEVSMTSELNDAEIWLDRIKRLSELPELRGKDDTKKYRFVYRMTLEDKERLGLAERGLRAFVPLETALARELGVASPAYPIFINDAFTPYNYGGIINEI